MLHINVNTYLHSIVRKLLAKSARIIVGAGLAPPSLRTLAVALGVRLHSIVRKLLAKSARIIVGAGLAPPSPRTLAVALGVRQHYLSGA
jgi:hypothetical protein